ncbi:MAG: CsgG/HfaB family protein [Elusimicrobiota bacterium]
MKNKYLKLIGIILLALEIGCAPIGVIRKGFDITNVERIGILSFSSYSTGTPSSGDMVADEFSKQLMIKGYTVVERRRIEAIMRELNYKYGDVQDPAIIREIGKKLGVDYLMTGTVSKYIPEKRYLVIKGQNDMIALDGAGVRTMDFTQDDASVVLTNADVGITARLFEVTTGNVVWIGSYSYESFDIETAVEWTVAGLTKMFKKKF